MASSSRHSWSSPLHTALPDNDSLPGIPLDDDEIPPVGTFLFADINREAEEPGSRYWIVLIIPDQRMPAHLQGKSGGRKIYPCWVMNRPDAPTLKHLYGIHFDLTSI